MERQKTHFVLAFFIVYVDNFTSPNPKISSTKEVRIMNFTSVISTLLTDRPL